MDDRETSAGVIDHLRRLDGVAIDIRRLETGDYGVGSLLFERKTIPDFARSIQDGRLFQQAARLAAGPQSAIVILEGTAVDLDALHMRREALQGALITLSVIFGIPVLRSQHPEETARLIYYTAGQVDRVITGGVIRHGYRPKRKKKRQLHILQGLPGVGPQKAANLLGAFGTVEKVIAAEAPDLAAVEGIGPKTAEAIRWAVCERASRYPSLDDFPL